MGDLPARAYFLLCRAFGRLLRAGRYASARSVDEDGELQVRKRRLFYAPALVWLGGPLVRILDTGVRILPQREWQERERLLFHAVHDEAIRIEADGTLVLPRLRGETLAILLENAELEASARTKAIHLAVDALARLHRLGFTHGDAMAENVMVDLACGAAHWFDFETLHEPGRRIAWRRADDLRALLATCLVRTAAGKQAETLRRILDVYADEAVARLVALSFASVWRRPLAFHLGQAPLSFESYRDIAGWLRERLGERDPPRSP